MKTNRRCGGGFVPPPRQGGGGALPGRAGREFARARAAAATARGGGGSCVGARKGIVRDPSPRRAASRRGAKVATISAAMLRRKVQACFLWGFSALLAIDIIAVLILSPNEHDYLFWIRM